jgi:TonB family protein
VGIAAASLVLGRISLTKDRVDEGIEYLSRSDEIFSTLPDLADSRLGLPAVSLGELFLQFGRLDLAEYYFQIALKSLSTDVPQEVSDYIDARSGLVSTYMLAGKGDLANGHCADVRRWSNHVNPRIKEVQEGKNVRVAPLYPWSALAKGIEGFVDFSFTVDEEGFVRSPTVIGVKGHTDFVPAALRALCKFKYPPRFENGKPVSVEDVKTRISFKIE